MQNLINQISCICLMVRKADRQLSQMYDRYLRPAGIRSTQYAMLRCVAELPAPFISDIGRVMNMDQTTVTRNIEKLEKARLVETSSHPGDPRKKVVALTHSGRSKLIEAFPLWEKAQNAALDCLGDKDLQHLMKILNKLTHLTKA